MEISAKWRKVAQRTTEIGPLGAKTTFSRTSCSPSEAAVAGTQLEMQFGDAKSDFRLHAFKSLGLHRNGSGQWRTHDHPWPKLNRQFRCSDCLVGLITDISTATKISAKPTSELHMIVSPQNSAENVTANRLSVHMMIDACEAGT